MLTKTKSETRTTSKDLSQQILEHIKRLAEETDAARMSEAMLDYLKMTAKFHNYSPQNIWLILFARPDASQVAGFHKWKGMGRFVKKGEKGIPILAPLLVKENKQDKEATKLIGFKVVYVFDVSQTEGEPLPETPQWKSLARDEELSEKLLIFAAQKGIAVSVEKLPWEIQGVSKGGRITLSPQAGTKTLVHELAHELLHYEKNEIFNSQISELEAESVAYVVCSHFGLPDLASPNYVALHGADSSMILEHLERIRKAAAEIILGIE